MKLAKNILTGATLLVLTTSAWSSEKTDSDFDKLLVANKISPKDQQSYCYTDEMGKIQGKNVDLQVRIASVTKLITSLWAIEEKGPNYRYDTKLFIKGKALHIQGSFDPFMSNEKLLFLVSQLNTLGYDHFDKITFDRNIQINPNAQIHSDQYPLITRESNRKNIMQYFNTKTWSSAFKAEYDRLASLAKKGRFLPEVHFSADAAEYSENNPLAENADNLPEGVKMLTLTSPELYKYLKETNVKSNNYSAHTIFKDLGGKDKFEQFLASRFGIGPDKLKLYNGNGLPEVIEGVRKDNYATCSLITELIHALKESAERQNRKLEDIVAVPGNDQGTFANRLNTSDYKNTFVAKTGTLMHTSTLAGALSTVEGFSFFGVFNQTTDIINAKKVQNAMVKILMNEMGGPKVFDYQVEGFHAYDNNSNVKNASFFEEEENSDLVSLPETGLY